MKLKALFLACAVAGACASIALADDGGGGDHHGRHHHGSGTTTTTMTTTTAPTTTTTPAGSVQVELRGTFVTVSATSFTFKVDSVDANNNDEDNDDNDDDDNGNNNNNAANALVGQTITIAVNANTRVRFSATGTLIGPNVGDTAEVEALMSGTPATFTALKVNAKGMKAAAAANVVKKHSKHHRAKSHK
jgi:hypothetical protein